MSQITVCRFIKFAQRGWYESRGWTVKPLMGNHGRYRLLATRAAT